MDLLSRAKSAANALLRLVNVRVESLTAERAETSRLQELERSRHFEKRIFPILPHFIASDPSSILEGVRRDRNRFAEIVDATKPGSFPLNNDYFTTPDAEVLYAIVQLYRPARVVEVGSGYSTQLFRVAINNAGIRTHLTSIDPNPRKEIAQQSDTIISERVETLGDPTLFQHLRSNDILFIDSSHEIKPGNDLLHLVFTVLPHLASGVLIHFHDIFLPYEYPREWIIENRWNWTEQYLVQALLTGNDSLVVLWPGYYLQRTRSDFENWFAHWNRSTARSLWLRKSVSETGA
jgi:predicted O-methyltransferase YrrM